MTKSYLFDNSFSSFQGVLILKTPVHAREHDSEKLEVQYFLKSIYLFMFLITVIEDTSVLGSKKCSIMNRYKCNPEKQNYLFI